MDFPNELILPVLVSNLLAIGLLILCYKKPRTGVIVWSVLFILAGIFNLFTAVNEPDAYLMYYLWALPPYREFIVGYFAEHTAMIVSSIALGQILIAVGLFIKNFRVLAIFGAIIFLVCITPLGWGSGFPATLIMAWSFWILYKKLLQ